MVYKRFPTSLRNVRNRWPVHWAAVSSRCWLWAERWCPSRRSSWWMSLPWVFLRFSLMRFSKSSSCQCQRYDSSSGRTECQESTVHCWQSLRPWDRQDYPWRRCKGIDEWWESQESLFRRIEASLKEGFYGQQQNHYNCKTVRQRR